MAEGLNFRADGPLFPLLEGPHQARRRKPREKDKHAMAATVTRRSELRKVKFGTTDMQVSELCIGSMTWGSFISDESAANQLIERGRKVAPQLGIPASLDGWIRRVLLYERKVRARLPLRSRSPL